PLRLQRQTDEGRRVAIKHRDEPFVVVAFAVSRYYPPQQAVKWRGSRKYRFNLLPLRLQGVDISMLDQQLGADGPGQIKAAPGECDAHAAVDARGHAPAQPGEYGENQRY